MMQRLKAGIPFITSLGFCLLIVSIINFTAPRVVPNELLFLPILIASVIKIIWTTFEFDVRMIEPFYIIFKGNAPREMSLKLLYQGAVYRWFPNKALFNGYYLLSLFGFSSILADILTITVSSFSANNMPSPCSPEDDVGDKTHKSFLGSVTLCIVLLSILILCAALMYALGRDPFLPSQPSTIAVVLTFTHASRMLYDLSTLRS